MAMPAPCGAGFTVFGLRPIGKADQRVIAAGLEANNPTLVARRDVVEHLERRPDDAMAAWDAGRAC